MVAFVVAAKHHVREEYDNEKYEDLNALVPASFLRNFKKRNGYGYGAADADYIRSRPRLANKTSVASFSTVNSTAGATPGPGNNSTDNPISASTVASPGFDREIHTDASAPLLAQQVYDDVVVVHKLHGRPSLPLPLVIAHRLQLYLAKSKAQGLMESVGPAGYNAMTQSISSLVNEFTSMERLLTLPLPVVYGVHLKQTVTLYLFVLPLVLVDTMTWKMVPFIVVLAFVLIGIEGIASEIEQPFGHDASDLPLDYMCAELRNEIEQMIARLRETPRESLML